MLVHVIVDTIQVCQPCPKLFIIIHAHQGPMQVGSGQIRKKPNRFRPFQIEFGLGDRMKDRRKKSKISLSPSSLVQNNCVPYRNESAIVIH